MGGDLLVVIGAFIAFLVVAPVVLLMMASGKQDGG